MSHKTTASFDVVVIGEKEDAHIPFVERYLPAPFIIIDAIATAAEGLSYVLHKGKLSIAHNGRPLDNVVGVWVRKQHDLFNPTLPVPAIHQGFAQSAVLRHTQALYAHLQNARWVSDYYAIRRASYKPLQLQLAARLGFKVPDTLFTSDPVQAKKFINKYKVTITKPIGLEITNDNEAQKFKFFATKIRSNEKVNLEGLSVAPAIFQQAIDAAADLRITVIGNKVFPAIITNEKLDPGSPIRDWRIGYIKGDMHIDAYKLPKDISDKCVALIRELGLEFGAIDLVLDKKGEVWFIENNAIGQWAFVEEVTGQAMGRALADLLQS